MNFLKSIIPGKTFWLVLFALALGTVLRLIFIDKPEGLWNDEYTSWYIASIPLGKGFVDAVFAQCHMPFYYLYLKFFMHFFGTSDLLLRLTSVLAGVLSILGMYFVGKELKDKRLGILAASFTAISSFLIYYSQEVRIYQVLFLFSSMSLLYTLRLLKQRTLSNFILYAFSNFLILFTHTIGFIYVFFNLIFVSFGIIKCDKKYKKAIFTGWGVMFAMFLAVMPLIAQIFTAKSFSQWWGHFTISKLGFLLTDYFSPVLINLVNAPDNFFFSFTFGFVVFAIVPTVIALAGMVKALQTKKYEISGLFLVSILTVIVLVIAAIAGKLVFITKYSIEIYPILIAIMGFGLLEIKNKYLRQFLIFLFCFLNLFYIFSNQNSAPKMHRSEGHKIVAELLKNAGLKKGDFILLNYYSREKYEKYFDFQDYNVVSMNKGNFPEYFGDANYQEVLKDGKKLYRDIFVSSENKYFDNKFKSEILDKLKKDQKLTVIVLNAVSMYSPIQVQKIAEDEKEYKKAPLLFLVFSYLKNQTLKESLKNLQLSRIENKGSWSAITFRD